ncbi:winged helix-turn-helix transcriptional regulator [Streptomyces sp. NPDC020490]|uniref:winged helix-turn-helix transcriptional regulator n=1 Tax=Streptomyces sp. NPDC020490 TaxID=3365078 RepID=UPI00379180BA
MGERWTLLIVRELLLGASSFSDIRRGLPRIPRATLAARLRALRAIGVIDDGYRLTQIGAALAPVVRELARWAVATDSAALTADDLDTSALTWDIQRRIDTSALPERSVVLALEFSDRTAPNRNFWLHLSRTNINLCRQDTGTPVDIWLTAPTEAVTRWWLGHMSWAQLLQDHEVQVHGDRSLQCQMHRWFQRYLFTPGNLGTAGSQPTDVP